MTSKRKLVGIVSPPYSEQQVSLKNRKDKSAKWIRSETGQKHIGYSNDENPNNIGNLKDTPNQLSADTQKRMVGITSPPFFQQGNEPNPNDKTIGIKGRDFARNLYGKTQGQISLLNDKNINESFDITQLHSCEDALYWTGCYASDISFKKFITSESFAHPAKASMLLMDKIFKHLKILGLLKKGDVVCDFMAGTARTNIMASLHGFDSIAVELEPHFIKMINQNKELLEKQMQKKINWQVVQGDSRKLTELLKDKKLVGITSPPYQEMVQGNVGGGIDWNKAHPNSKKEIMQKSIRSLDHEYSQNPSNIGNLSDKKLVGITSPPFEDSEVFQDKSFIEKINQRTPKRTSNLNSAHGIYAESNQNLGNQQGESYLQAMQQVYEQASQLMPIIVTITKNPTRKGQLRRLDLDTARLLESCGYSIIDYHRSLLFEEMKQATLKGGIKKELKGRLSFFKRLSVLRGNTAANFEDIIIAVKDR